MSWTGSAWVGDLSDFWKGGALVRDSETDHGYIIYIEKWEVCVFLDMPGLRHNLGQSIKGLIKSHWPG